MTNREKFVEQILDIACMGFSIAVIEKTMINLERNNMKAYYAENKAQVCEIVKGMLFPGAVITAGGSVSLNESGVWDIISDPEYKFFNILT